MKSFLHAREPHRRAGKGRPTPPQKHDRSVSASRLHLQHLSGASLNVTGDGGGSVQAETQGVTQGPFDWKTFKGTMVSVVSVGEEAHLESTLLKSSPEYKHSCCSVGGKHVCSWSETSRETSPADVGASKWMKLESIVKISNNLLILLHPQLQLHAGSNLVKLWTWEGTCSSLLRVWVRSL